LKRGRALNANKPDDACNLGLVKDCTPEAGSRQMLLAGNPGRLFGFDS